MSKKFFVGFLSAAQLAAVHDAGHIVEAFVMSEGQKLVARLKATSIGATVASDIATLKDASLSGAQKFAQVVAQTAPLIIKYATSGGAALVANAEDVARELVQSVYNDTLGAVKDAANAAAATVAEQALQQPQGAQEDTTDAKPFSTI